MANGLFRALGRGLVQLGVWGLCWVGMPAPLVRAEGEAPVAHEFIPNVDQDEATRAVLAAQGRGAEVVVHRGTLVEPPRPPRPGNSGTGATPDLLAQRGLGFRPDRQTGFDGELSYYASFDPMVAPFKRVLAFDRVGLGRDGRTPVLQVGERARWPVPIGEPPPDEGWDRFWGEVQLAPGQRRLWTLPSVAPEVRILALRATPALALRVERDAADNYFLALRAPAPTPTGPVHVAFLMAAPRSYFGMTVPSGLPANTLASQVAPLPPSVSGRARVFLSSLGLSPTSDFRAALFTLVGYFRGFSESDEPPLDTGDIFSDLVQGRRGICRHRSYGFVVAAQALGIPARFVQNEAHSFVEVQVPERGYLRIDLGGASRGLTARGTAGRVAYRPSEPAELPRPEAYRASLARAAQQLVQPDATGTGTGTAVGQWLPPRANAGQGGISRAMAEGRALGGEHNRLAVPRAGAGAGGMERRPVVLTLARRAYHVVRGQTMTVHGHLRDRRGKGVAGLQVELSLASAGRRERLLLGIVTSGALGDFRAELQIPPDLPPEDYRLIALTDGNQRYGPAIAH